MNSIFLITIIITIFIFFISMILSSLASSDSQSKNCGSSHKYSMYAAILNGVGVFSGVAILLTYLYYIRKEITLNLQKLQK